MRLRVGSLVFALFVVLFAASYASVPRGVSAQAVTTADPVCTNLVSQAVSAASALCGSAASDTACFGNRNVLAELSPNSTTVFNQPGDIVSLSDIVRLRTSVLDPQTTSWGIAVLTAKENLTGTAPDQNVTFVVYGDTTVDNPMGDMSVVTINTRITEPLCVDAPNSGVIIHAPEGSQAQFGLNGVAVTLGSCALVTADDEAGMTFAVVEGTGIVSVFGTPLVVPAGSQVRIPLGGGLDALQATGDPSAIEPYDFNTVSAAPLAPAGCTAPVPPPATVVPIATGVTAGCTRPDWTFTYVVQFGDTLSRIASSIGISLSELAAGNSISDVNQISVGQVLCVPREVPPFALPTFTLTPTGTLTVTVEPTIEPTVEPTTDPGPDPTVEPTTDPGPGPDPTVEPTVDPGPGPGPDPTVEVTVSP